MSVKFKKNYFFKSTVTADIKISQKQKSKEKNIMQDSGKIVQDDGSFYKISFYHLARKRFELLKDVYNNKIRRN